MVDVRCSGVVFLRLAVSSPPKGSIVGGYVGLVPLQPPPKLVPLPVLLRGATKNRARISQSKNGP